MPLTKVLIKFMSPHPAGNVISAAALGPEILIPVGYGSFLTDTMRSRYNYFFHVRQLPTIIAEPVQLEKYLMGDIEIRLEQLLARYEARRPVVDISDADPIETMALGIVLRAHKYWSITVLDYRVRDSIFLPLRNGDYLKQLAFPNLTHAELLYLRDGRAMDLPLTGDNDMSRADLTREVIRQIRALSVLYAETPAFWRDVSQRLKHAAGRELPKSTELLLDTSLLMVPDRAFEEMRDSGILKEYIRRNGVSRIVFADRSAMRLFWHIERVPVINVFVAAAFVREYGRSAAYHDLILHDFGYITGIHDCLPLVLAIYSEQEEAQQIYRFHVRVGALFDGPVRKVLVRFGSTSLSEEVRRAAEELEVELIPMKQLAEKLEPR